MSESKGEKIERRIAVIPVDVEFMFRQLQRRAIEPWMANATLLQVKLVDWDCYSPRAVVKLLVSSPLLPEVPEGIMAPEMNPTIRIE